MVATMLDGIQLKKAVNNFIGKHANQSDQNSQMNSEESLMKNLYLIALVMFTTPPIYAGVSNEDYDRCSVFLDKIAASSNLLLISKLKIEKNKISVDVDHSVNNDIFAKVQVSNMQSLDTPGAGFIAWVKYDYVRYALDDITTDPGVPLRLKFDERYAPVYKNCLTHKPIYEVIGSGRLQFYQDKMLSKTHAGKFILPGEYIEIENVGGNSSFVKYRARNGSVISAWVESSRIRKAIF